MLLKHVRDAWIDQGHVDEQWKLLNYVGAPDFDRALDEYDAFVDLLRGFGIEVAFLPQEAHDAGMGLDSVYVRDASLVTDEGAILCSMGKDARAGEPGRQGSYFTENDIPVLGAIDGEGRIEGGDVAWLKSDLLTVARGYRTNDEGIRQLRALLDPQVRIEVMHSPHYRGPGDVFHLMSVISPIADDLALVYSPLMSVPFREMLLSTGFELVEVPEAEFDSLGGNVLAVAPRVAVIPKGNPETVSRLRAAGSEVYEFDAAEISLKGCGGPTCLTRPLDRTRSV
jgi:N-dimethylarginine dimethylaminohydrolase